MKVLLVFAGSAALALSLGSTSWACSCMAPSPCDRQRYGDADFVGEVVSRRFVFIDAKLTGSPIGERRNLYQIRVMESFRGEQRVGDLVDVETGLGDWDCGYHFEKGNKYLIDAWKRDSVLQTGICSRTAPVDRDQGDLRILRKIAAHQPLPDLQGVLLDMDGLHAGHSVPLARTSISLKSETNSFHATVVSDANGSFEFHGLRPGAYRFHLGLPGTLSAEYADFGQVEGAVLPPIVIEKVPGVVCHAEIAVGPASGIAGVVKNLNGKQGEGWVTADTVTSDGRPTRTVLSREPNASGLFLLAHLKPGRYQVQFARKGWQGLIQGEPQIVDLKEGEQKTGIVLVAK